MKITVDYEVPMTVRLDTITGKVEEIWVHGESFQSCAADRIRVFAGGDRDWEGPEYLAHDHPEAVKALAIADRVSLTPCEFELAFTEDSAA